MRIVAHRRSLLSTYIPTRQDSPGCRLPFGDKSAPERIKEEFGISKAAFKRALGHLLKEGKIRVAERDSPVCGRFVCSLNGKNKSRSRPQSIFWPDSGFRGLPGLCAG